MMENLFKIFTILSPFIAAFLVHFLGLRAKRKDIELDKEKEINKVISNLLECYQYLKRIERSLSWQQSKFKSFIPASMISAIMEDDAVKSKAYFEELDESIKYLKPYDPAIYIEISGIGNKIFEFRNKYILPISELSLNNQTEDPNIPLQFTNKVCDRIKLAIEQLAFDIQQANKYKELLENSNTESIEIQIDEANKVIYDNLYVRMPENLKANFTFDSFNDGLQKGEWNGVIDFSSKLYENDNFSKMAEILKENPKATMDDIIKILKNE